jgi:hypothetical protein
VAELLDVVGQAVHDALNPPEEPKRRSRKKP